MTTIQKLGFRASNTTGLANIGVLATEISGLASNVGLWLASSAALVTGAVASVAPVNVADTALAQATAAARPLTRADSLLGRDVISFPAGSLAANPYLIGPNFNALAAWSMVVAYRDTDGIVPTGCLCGVEAVGSAWGGIQLNTKLDGKLGLRARAGDAFAQVDAADGWNILIASSSGGSTATARILNMSTGLSASAVATANTASATASFRWGGATQRAQGDGDALALFAGDLLGDAALASDLAKVKQWLAGRYDIAA